mgnify:CR=1 FL=1|tara:strand:- start:1010 stop:1924 length:915 start_codon:yes stop_codon:yes gene_type:complete
MSYKIVFMGTPAFSLPVLKKLINNKFNVLAVYTQAPKKSHRGQKINISPVQSFSEKNNILVKHPEKLDDEYNFIKGLSADLAVVVAYGKLIPKKILGTTKLGFINIHASLLPRWRGAAPIQRAIMEGDKKTGVSIMRVEEKLDSGPVMAFQEIEINKSSTYGEIEEKLAEMGADLLIDSLKKIKTGNQKFVDQIHSKATYAKKIKKEEAKINWYLNADQVIAQIHGLNPSPGAWFKFEKERIKVWKAKKILINGSPGKVLDENLTIGCKTNSIQILEIQREGKKKQTTKDFLLGKKIDKNSYLL